MRTHTPPIRGASTRLLRKGILLSETYQFMTRWDESKSIRKNIETVSQSNPSGASNVAWLREVSVTLSSRFRSPEVVEPLVLLAKAGFPILEWRWFLLWLTQITDVIFSRFVLDWLFPHFEKGVHNLRADQVAPFFRELICELAGEPKEISEYGVIRGGRDLLRMAADFGLVEGRSSKNFGLAHVPESAFLWALYDLYAQTPNAYKMIRDPRWRLFLFSPAAVEREILDLHQFQKLDYQTAGSLSQLKLPYPDGMTYLRTIAHG
jgi:Putative inner membrane protein (DUF1819)